MSADRPKIELRIFANEHESNLIRVFREIRGLLFQITQFPDYSTAQSFLIRVDLLRFAADLFLISVYQQICGNWVWLIAGC
jgi:hypothetical protein